MNRVSFAVHEDDGTERAVWFDLDAVTERIVEGQRLDSQGNLRGARSGLQTNLAVLYRTANGRWILHTDARMEYNGPDTWEILSDAQARDWVLLAESKNEEATLARYWPDLAESAL